MDAELLRIAPKMLTAGMMILALSGCGEFKETEFSDSRDLASVAVDEGVPEAPGSVDAGAQIVTLKEAMNVRYSKAGILEVAEELPAGSELRVFSTTAVSNPDFRNSSGKVERSSTGFMNPVEVVKAGSLSAERLEQLNAMTGGLFISASISGELFRGSETLPALVPSTPGSGFLLSFTSEGRPKFSYSTSIRKRFPNRVNVAIPLASLSADKQTKWTKIYAELARAGDRTAASPRDLMIIETATARALSIKFEKEGFVSPIGAWSIAVEGTASRHGFANVPCAETMSELIRQAYKRAGYSHTEDFNAAKGNILIWSKTAAVVELSRSLNVAGWVPWDTTEFRPKTGAIMMHTTGISPGHTYMAGGHDGRLIVDNGSPRGRDLRATSDKIIKMMYRTGVFFLPPGIQPERW